MSSEMVERLAEELAPYIPFVERLMGEHVDAAKDVLRAMREPTAAQMAEAMNIDGPVSRGQMTAIEIYQALIDAALDEKEGGE